MMAGFKNATLVACVVFGLAGCKSAKPPTIASINGIVLGMDKASVSALLQGDKQVSNKKSPLGSSEEFWNWRSPSACTVGFHPGEKGILTVFWVTGSSLKIGDEQFQAGDDIESVSAKLKQLYGIELVAKDY